MPIKFLISIVSFFAILNLIIIPSIEVWLISKFIERHVGNSLLPQWITNADKSNQRFAINSMRDLVLKNVEMNEVYYNFQKVLKKVSHFLSWSMMFFCIAVLVLYFIVFKADLYFDIIFSMIITLTIVGWGIQIFSWEKVKDHGFMRAVPVLNLKNIISKFNQRKDALSVLILLEAFIFYLSLMLACLFIFTSTGVVKIRLRG